MKHYLFCLFLYLTLAILFYYAPSTNASPIINGIPDEPRRAKFSVSIHKKSSSGNQYKFICSGSIISERYILTAAHCFSLIRNVRNINFFFPRSPVKIIAGSNNRYGPGIERDIIRVFIPSGPSAAPLPADIAVAELSADLGVHHDPENLAIIPLEALDPHSNAGVNRQATFWGFGHDVLARQRNGQLVPSESSRNVISRFMDVRLVGRNEYARFEHWICVRNSDPREFRTACYGDSGAGLIYDEKLVGVLSNGPPNCDTNALIDFTRLYGYMRFIEEAVNPHGDHSNMHVLDGRAPEARGGRPAVHRGRRGERS